MSDGRWEEVAPLPLGRNSAASAVLEGQIYVMGGRLFDRGHENHSRVGNGNGNDSERWITYPAVWSYNPQMDSGCHVGDMPSSRHGMGAVAKDGKIYLLGGALGAGIDRTQNRIDILSR